MSKPTKLFLRIEMGASIMKRTTRKLSGQTKTRFLARFIAEEPGLAADVAARLAERCDTTFTSLRIRRAAIAPLRTHAPVKAARTSRPPAVETHSGSAENAVSAPSTPPTAFDPYAFGLVPVFQREGRDGLLAKLASVTVAADLRLMAKTQQIVLPAEFRSGNADAAAIRGAIADAVAKRLADRRAAAG